MNNNIKKFWPTLKRLLKYAILWKKTLVIALFLLTTAALFEVLGPIIMSYFINHIIAKKNFNLIIIIVIIICFITLQALSIFLQYFQTILFNKTSVQIVQKIRRDVMQAALQLPLNIFDTEPIGQIISRVTNDTEAVKELYDTVLVTFVRSITLIGIILIAMFTLEWHMAIIAIMIFPVVICITLIYYHYSIPILRELRIYIAKINSGFHEIINGMHIIQQFRQEDKFKKSILNQCEAHYLIRMKTLKLDGFLLRPLLSLFSALVLCGLIVQFTIFPIGVFEIGILYAFISYLGRLNEPLIAITSQQSILQQAIVSGERIFSLIDIPKQKYGKNSEKLKYGSIRIKNLSFSYKNNYLILKNINCYIPSKKFVAFVGHTGSGKSTLANLLMGYYPTYQGNIYIDGKPLNSLSYDCLREGILMVQQEPTILADTLFSNIALGKNISESEIWKILKIVQLSSLALSMPKGIFSILGEQGNNLSVGQKQLLSIARILVRKPKILILDEATSNIDSETEQLVQKTFNIIKKHTTLIVIAHRLSTILDANKIIVIDKGKILETGTHQELLKQRKLYWKMYNMQLKNSYKNN